MVCLRAAGSTYEDFYARLNMLPTRRGMHVGQGIGRTMAELIELLDECGLMDKPMDPEDGTFDDWSRTEGKNNNWGNRAEFKKLFKVVSAGEVRSMTAG